MLIYASLQRIGQRIGSPPSLLHRKTFLLVFLELFLCRCSRNQLEGCTMHFRSLFHSQHHWKRCATSMLTIVLVQQTIFVAMQQQNKCHIPSPR